MTIQRRTAFEASIDKKRAVSAAEDAGMIADSQAVRLALMEKVRNGSITLAEAQAELRKIQREASKNGKTTKAAVFRAG